MHIDTVSLLCAIGNTIFEPNKEGSHYRGGGSSSGDNEEAKKDDTKQEEGKKEENKS